MFHTAVPDIPWNFMAGSVYGSHGNIHVGKYPVNTAGATSSDHFEEEL